MHSFKSALAVTLATSQFKCAKSPSESSIKISVFKQQRVPNAGTKSADSGGNWEKIREKFARRANVLSKKELPLDRLASNYYVILAESQLIGGHTEYLVLMFVTTQSTNVLIIFFTIIS